MTATLFLRSLKCLEPATGAGDDIEVFADGDSVEPQFNIDQGQAHRFPSGKTFEFDESTLITFTEDTDPAPEGDTTVTEDMAGSVKKIDVQIKQDGRYELFVKVKKI